MKKFLDDTEAELQEYFNAESEKENDKLVEEYHRELDTEVLGSNED